MQTAFKVEVKDWPSVAITEFSYEKRTPQYYVGCKAVGHIHNHAWIGKRVPADQAFDTLEVALRLADIQLRGRIDSAKRTLNDWRSRLGELEKTAKALGISTSSETSEGKA
jgi:flagellar basal body P-ring protein FlgI